MAMPLSKQDKKLISKLKKMIKEEDYENCDDPWEIIEQLLDIIETCTE